MLPNRQQSLGDEIESDLDFMILTARGQFVYHPDASLIMNRTVFEQAAGLGRPDLAVVGRAIVSGQAGVASADGWDSPGRQWIFFAPIQSAGWAFAARVPERAAMAAVRQRVAFAGVALGATLVLIIGCIWYVSGHISRPIERLRSTVQRIAGGDLEARAEGITHRDEIGELALADAIGRVNNLLHADMPQGRFVTAAVGIIDPKAVAMTLVSAGQAPMLYYEAKTGAVHNWPADDLPLGLVHGLSFESPREIRFGAGDVLVLTTDGFLEWPDAGGRQFGSKRLVEFLRANHGLAPGEFIAQLYQAVRAHGAGVTQGDDLTALVIKRGS